MVLVLVERSIVAIAKQSIVRTFERRAVYRGGTVYLKVCVADVRSAVSHLAVVVLGDHNKHGDCGRRVVDTQQNERAYSGLVQLFESSGFATGAIIVNPEYYLCSVIKDANSESVRWLEIVYGLAISSNGFVTDEA